MNAVPPFAARESSADELLPEPTEHTRAPSDESSCRDGKPPTQSPPIGPELRFFGAPRCILPAD